MSNWRILYWFVVGACFGFGLIGILSIGIFFFAAGLALLIFGAIRFRGRRLWAAIIGFGVAPAALLLWDVTSQPWACNPGGPGQSGISAQPGVNYYSCVNTFAGPLTTYHVMAAIFGAIAIVGIIWGLAALWWGATHHTGGGNGGPRHAAA